MGRRTIVTWNAPEGDRGGKLLDPFGHKWWIASHVQDVPREEQPRRAAELYGMTG